MAGPFRDYVLGLSVLALTMGGYQMTVARWLKPPVIEHAPVAVRVLTDNDESLVDLYPADAWQRGRSIRLKTQDGMLLFQNWEQNKDDRDGGKKWRLWPITMVIGRGLDAKGASQPIVIEAEQGAVIEFSASLDVMSGVAPTIQRGQLMGDVQIRRINGIDENAISGSNYQVQADDQTLDIRTANVGIDRRKIWTTEAIEMKVGRAVMVGRDLTLHLATSTGSGASQSSIARSLDRMELIYLRELTLPLGKAGDPAGKNDGVVQVRCDGRIDYDFALDQLMLDRNVRLMRVTPTSPQNPSVIARSTPLDRTDADATQERFECDSLRLTIRDPLNSHRERKTAFDWIDRIEATGSPVRLSMKSQGFDLIAGKVVFDPVEGWLTAEPVTTKTESFNGGSASRQDNSPVVGKVQIRRGDLIANLSRIVYQFDPKYPEQLGSIEVKGRGDIDYQSPESVLKSFGWNGGLRVAPLDVATPDALNVRFGVWCDGAIEARLADGGSFVTDRIEGVLKPVESSIASPSGSLSAKTPLPAKTPLSARTPRASTSNIDQQWFPDRFSAIGNVRIQAPNLDAQTNQMNLFFEQKQLYPGASQATSSTPDSSVRSWVSQPGSDSNSGTSNTRVPKVQATIRGDQVTAKLTFGDRELTATDLSVVGNVAVSHPLQLRTTTSTDSANLTQPMLATMTGDHLRIRDGGGSDVLQLGSRSGNEARLELGDGYFVGPEIQVRPDDNYVWVPSAGELLIPTAFLPSLGGLSGSLGGQADATSTRWSRSPRCRFGGSMTFDGKVAILGGGVELEAAIVSDNQPSEIRMLGDELRFMLETQVDFRVPESFRTTQLKQVSLLQTTGKPVEVRVDQFAGDGIRQSRHELSVASLNWMPGASPPGSIGRGLTGQVVAPGPGSYRGWIRGKAEASSADGKQAGSSQMGAAFSPGMIEDSNAPTARKDGEETVITGVHLVFQEAMQGDLLSKSLIFKRGVRIARKIVEDFEQTFQATDMDRLGPDELTLDCDQVRLSLDPSVRMQAPKFNVPGRSMNRPPSIEVEAYGGVVFRSRTERGLSQATADRCGYAVAKDLVTIEGTPGRPARFQQTDMTGEPVVNLAIRTMTLRLRPFQLISSQVESFQTGALPDAVSPKR